MRFLRWTAALALLALTGLLLVLPAVGLVGAIVPPRAVPAAAMVPADVAGLPRRCGAGELAKVGDPETGVWFCRLEGTPAEIGWQHGALIGDRIVRMEREMMDTFVSLVPGFPARHLLLGLVALNGRTLPDHFLPRERDEIAAAVAGAEATWPSYQGAMPHTTRALHYHALHDISHYLIDNPLVRPPQLGCTAVAVGPSRSSTGGMLTARLFDFEGGRAFDRDKVVHLVRPRHGLAFLSVGFPGAAGVVTGLNEAGLFVCVNAGATITTRTVGRPVIMAVREAMETCRTIAEAEAVFARSHVFVSEGILVASGPERRAVVIELAPHGMAVVPMADDHLVVTNHFRAPLWQDDPVNRMRIADGTTTARFARASELLLAQPRHDPASLLALLRDRRGAGGADVGFANRSTVNAWIGAHLAVADLERKVIWVCETPHGLGRAWAFGFDGPLTGDDLPAAEDLPLWQRAAQPWAVALRRARALLARGDRAGAAAAAAEAAALNPRSFESAELLALTADDPAARERHARAALALQPAYAEDRRRIGALLPAGAP